jgi:hypothetical protein
MSTLDQHCPQREAVSKSILTSQSIILFDSTPFYRTRPPFDSALPVT